MYLLCVSPRSLPKSFEITKDNSKSLSTRCTSLESLCFLAHDVIPPPTSSLNLNELSAELYFSIANSHLICFTRKRPFLVACNNFPLDYFDALTSLCTSDVYYMYTDMVRNFKLGFSCKMHVIYLFTCIALFSFLIKWDVMK